MSWSQYRRPRRVARAGRCAPRPLQFAPSRHPPKAPPAASANAFPQANRPCLRWTPARSSVKPFIQRANDAGSHTPDAVAFIGHLVKEPFQVVPGPAATAMIDPIHEEAQRHFTGQLYLVRSELLV